MKTALRLHDPAGRSKLLASAECEIVESERSMLLHLATELQLWPARNPVFRSALDRASADLAKMAGQVEAS